MRLAGVAGIIAAILLIAASRSSTIRFSDVAAQAGIRFVLENSPNAQKVMIGNMSGGIDVMD